MTNYFNIRLWITEYICLNMNVCHSRHLNKNFFCAHDCLNSNLYACIHLLIILKILLMHQKTYKLKGA